jgi:hypothetical protein
MEYNKYCISIIAMLIDKTRALGDMVDDLLELSPCYWGVEF